MEQPGFWDDVAKSTSVSRQLKKLQDSLEEYQKLEQDFSDIETLIQMAEEEGDSSMIEEIGEMLTAFQKEFENYRISLLLSGEFDGYDAVMTLHAGAGGTESCDWTSMLYRMYTRWAEKHGFKLDVSPFAFFFVYYYSLRLHHFKYAFINPSSSPSKTAATFPLSSPVR